MALVSWHWQVFMFNTHVEFVLIFLADLARKFDVTVQYCNSWKTFTNHVCKEIRQCRKSPSCRPSSCHRIESGSVQDVSKQLIPGIVTEIYKLRCIMANIFKWCFGAFSCWRTYLHSIWRTRWFPRLKDSQARARDYQQPGLARAGRPCLWPVKPKSRKWGSLTKGFRDSQTRKCCSQCRHLQGSPNYSKKHKWRLRPRTGPRWQER